MNTTPRGQEPEQEQIEGIEDEIIPFRHYAITSYGADYPIDGLVKRIRDGSIFVPPFQRGFVWNQKKASRFVESLLLGLPVPGIFLSKEYGSQKLLVIDGQQRLRTLQYFYEGIFPLPEGGREFALTGLTSEFEGATYRTIPDEDRRRLDDAIIHAVIVKQDEPSDDDSSIYHIFERLNSGATQLKEQEIRSAIYHGSFNDLIKDLNKNEDWRELFGVSPKDMRDQELILRFIALLFVSASYSKPMKEFLNKYMGKYRELDEASINNIKHIFIEAVRAINQFIGTRAFRPKRAINAAVLDAVMVGVARRLSKGPIENGENMQTAYNSLLNNSRFVTVTETSTSDEENIRIRLQLATEAFDKV